MNHQGHGLPLQHAIYSTPNAVRFPASPMERPEHNVGLTSPLYPDGMGETYDVVDFEVRAPGAPNPTIVSHEGFFTDVPGFENLAEGQSAKMLGSLSLARQGRYFYWGYSIDPDLLTDPAEDTLENVLRYMAKRRGEETVPFVCKTRRSLWIYLRLNEESGYLRGIEEHFLGLVGAESRKDYVPTPDGLRTWLDENLPYVYAGKPGDEPDGRYGHRFHVDFEAKALGTPNAERASLERWCTLAVSGDETERARARTLLARYVHPDVAPASWDSAQEWYRKEALSCVFVESAGFWWMRDPSPK
jgi:hypothetical protein